MFTMLLNTESGFIVLQTGYGITIELARLGCVSFFSSKALTLEEIVENDNLIKDVEEMHYSLCFFSNSYLLHCKHLLIVIAPERR